MTIIQIRASSLSTLCDCPARWEAVHIDGKKMPGSAPSTLGTAVHAGAEAFDRARMEGNPIKAMDAAGAVVDAIYKPKEDVDWSGENPQDAERIALSLHAKYCAEIAPYRNYTGIEVTCERLEITDLGIALTGTTDRIERTADGQLGVRDLKTGKAAVGTDGRATTEKHIIQLGVYELLAESATGEAITAPAEIIGMNTAKTAAAQRIGTGQVVGAKQLLIGTDDQPGVLEIASKIIHGGLFFGNPRSQLCSAKYCPIHNTCRFRGAL